MLNLKVAQLQCKPTYHMLCIQIQENRNTQLSLIFGYNRSLLLRLGCPQFLRLGVFSSCGRQASHCYSFSCCGVQLQAHGLQQLQHAGSVVVAHGFSCFMACGIFLDQGLNPCPLHWQANSYLLHHQGSPLITNFLIPFSTFAKSTLKSWFSQWSQKLSQNFFLNTFF